MPNQLASYKLTIKPLKTHLAFSTVNKFGKKLVSKNMILISSRVDVKNTQMLSIYEGNRSIIQQPCAYLKNKIYLGLKVSKKCSKSAVVRNLIKRRLKASMRQIIRDWYISNYCSNSISSNYEQSPNQQIHNGIGDSNWSGNATNDNPLTARAYLIIPHRHFASIKYSDLVIELRTLLQRLI